MMRSHKKILLAAILLCGCTNNPGDTGADAATPADGAAAADLAQAGGCGAGCGGLTPKCNASGHCVGCLVDGDCPMGSYCKIASDTMASCAPGCASDNNCANAQKCCGNRCVDTMSDGANCGGCGMACSAPHVESIACNGGKCGAGSCDPGWADCDQDPKNGCEVNLHADANNCTACGMKCAIKNAYVACADGCFATACKFGFDDCNNNAADGCEASVLSDKNNCGGCGKPCTNLPNATATCANGSCLLGKCNPGFADCNGLAADGCEVNTATDGKNCGACGNVCGNGLTCVQGGCTCAMCNIPNASANCVNNQCVFARCNPGFADCNNNVADGCEVNLNGDKNNCGQCGNVCPMNLPSCNGGQCSLLTCPNNAQWMPVACQTGTWVWSSDRTKATTVQTANSLHLLWSGCKHAGDVNNLDGKCSLDGKGWVSTQTFTMAGCDASWYHLGGSYTGNCGGHDGDTVRHLVIGDNDCFAY